MTPVKEVDEITDSKNISQPPFMTTPVLKKTEIVELDASSKFTPQMPSLSGKKESEPPLAREMKQTEGTPLKKSVEEAPKSAPVKLSNTSSMSTPTDRKPREQPPSSGSSKYKLRFYFRL
jgi:hypothetical protein